MNYYPLALVILLAFAGGWVWRGAWDVWRTPKAKVYGTTNMVWGTASGTSSAQATINDTPFTMPQLDEVGRHYKPPPLRAVE